MTSLIKGFKRGINRFRFLKKTLRKTYHFYISTYSHKHRKIRPEKYPFGINYLGFIRSSIGLGESCRLIASGIKASGIDHTVISYEKVPNMVHQDHTWDAHITNTFPYLINVFHVNPPELPYLYLNIKSKYWVDRYNIGLWLWELEKLPQQWIDCIELLDEIWAPSQFITESIKKVTKKPVTTIKYPIKVIFDAKFDRNYFGLPLNKFIFLTMFDSKSAIERKNPYAVVKAFQLSFGNQENVCLCIKMNNPDDKEVSFLNEMIKNNKNIVLIPKIMSKVEVSSLINDCDVLVSMHRAEGFGLPLIEAMYLGKPTIATNWSANTEFMSQDNSCLVDYDLIEITEDHGIYTKGNHWADPKVNHASFYMKKLFNDPDYYRQISTKAAQHIKSEYSLDNASDIILKRMDEIRKMVKK